MHITDIMRGDSPTFSFEFFPPKTAETAETLYQTIRDLEAYMPHFVSVTYGAGGSTRELTHELVERIQHSTKLDPIPHLTCICHKEEEIEAILLRYAASAIGNILALGGDRPPEMAYDKSRDSFQHAIDLKIASNLGDFAKCADRDAARLRPREAHCTPGTIIFRGLNLPKSSVKLPIMPARDCKYASKICGHRTRGGCSL